MKWPVFLHTPNIFVGTGLRGLDQKMFNRMKKRIEEHCATESLSVTKMKEVIDLFHETAAAGLDESMTLLRHVMKYLRHKLIDSTVTGYLKLIHLIDALMRNCGIRAHVLIGRQKFLHTICYLSLNFKKNKSKLTQEAADFSYKCMEDWTTALDERRDIFPYYSVFLEKMRPISFRLDLSKTTFTVTPLQLEPVTIDPAYRLESNLYTPPPTTASVRVPTQDQHQLTECDEGSVMIQDHAQLPMSPEMILSYQKDHSRGTSPRGSHTSSVGLHVESEALTSHDANEHDDDDDVLRAEQGTPEQKSSEHYRPETALKIDEPTSSDPENITPTNRQLSTKLNDYLSAVNASSSKNVERRKSASSDSNIEIKFFGTQRIVVSKQDVLSNA